MPLTTPYRRAQASRAHLRLSNFCIYTFNRLDSLGIEKSSCKGSINLFMPAALEQYACDARRQCCLSDDLQFLLPVCRYSTGATVSQSTSLTTGITHTAGTELSFGGEASFVHASVSVGLPCWKLLALPCCRSYLQPRSSWIEA